MSVSGPCDICTTGTVEASCDRCGQLVCGRHYDESTGFCVECTAELGGGGSDTDSGEELPDGVDTYEF